MILSVFLMWFFAFEEFKVEDVNLHAGLQGTHTERGTEADQVSGLVDSGGQGEIISLLGGVSGKYAIDPPAAISSFVKRPKQCA